MISQTAFMERNPKAFEHDYEVYLRAKEQDDPSAQEPRPDPYGLDDWHAKALKKVVEDRLIPPSMSYGHEETWRDGNGHSHLQATVLGPSLTVPVRDGRLVLGTWQQIFHLECDVKPRSRRIVVTVVGE